MRGGLPLRRSGPRWSRRAAELAAVVCDDRAQANALATLALRRAVASAEQTEEALIRAIGELAGPEGLGRLLLLLVDVENRPESHVARLVGLLPEDLRRQLADARTAVGLRGVPPHCRGWELVRRRATATAAEVRAAEGHLQVCRRCRGRLEEAARAREALVKRSVALSAVVAADAAAVAGAVTGGGGVALGAGILGKAGVAIIGATALAIGAAAGSVAAARAGGSSSSPTPGQQPSHHRGVHPGPPAVLVGSVPPAGSAHSGSGSKPSPGEAALPTGPLPTSTSLPSLPALPNLPAPTLSTDTTAVLPLPLPTLTTAPLLPPPSLPPVPLLSPTVLPTGLPTGLPGIP